MGLQPVSTNSAPGAGGQSAPQPSLWDRFTGAVSSGFNQLDNAAHTIGRAIDHAADSGIQTVTNGIREVAGDNAANTFQSGANAVKNAGEQVVGFDYGLAHGAVSEVGSMAKGVGTLAGDVYSFATDPTYRGQVIDAAGNLASQVANDPGGTLSRAGSAIYDAGANWVQGAEQAAQDGNLGEYLGNGVGHAGVAIGSLVVPGADVAEGLGLTGRAGEVASALGRTGELAGDTGRVGELGELGGDVGRLGEASDLAPLADPATAADYAGDAVPRTGAPGSTPTGTPEVPPANNAEMARSLTRQNESLDSLADLGYDVEHQPAIQPSDVGLDPAKNPDARIGGEIFDVYSPRSANVDNVVSNMAGKVDAGQTNRLVVNLSDSPLTQADVEAALAQNPIADLKELVIVDGKDGSVARSFPDPVDLNATRPPIESLAPEVPATDLAAPVDPAAPLDPTSPDASIGLPAAGLGLAAAGLTGSALDEGSTPPADGTALADPAAPFDLTSTAPDPNLASPLVPDLGALDLGPTDIGMPDIGTPDLGVPDLGSPSLGMPDFGTPNLGLPDLGSPSFGTPDFGTPDFGLPDLGSPSFGTPDFGTPDLGLPDFGAPSFGTPDLGTPDFGSPGLGGSDLGTSDFGSSDLGGLSDVGGVDGGLDSSFSDIGGGGFGGGGDFGGGDFGSVSAAE